MSCKYEPLIDMPEDKSLTVGPPQSKVAKICFMLVVFSSFFLSFFLVVASRLTCGLLVKRCPWLTWSEEISHRQTQILLHSCFAQLNYTFFQSGVELGIKKLQAIEENLMKGVNVQTDEGCLARYYTLCDDDDGLSDKHLVFIWLHGGGYAIGSAYSTSFYIHNLLTQLKTANVKAAALCVHYPLAHLAKARSGKAIHAVEAAHSWVSKWCANAKIVLGGDSAGGHLSIVSTLNKRLSIEGLVLISPWCNVDPESLRKEDIAKQFSDIITGNLVGIWANQFAEGYYSHPNVCINHEDLGALPKHILVEAGGGEILINQIKKFVQAATDQKKEVQFFAPDHMPHDYMLLEYCMARKEGIESMTRIGNFLISLIKDVSVSC